MKIRPSNLSKKLKKLREEKRITQEALAKELGVSRQSIISLEQGRCLPSLPLAISFSELFHLPFEQIFDIGFENRKEESAMTKDLTPWSPMREVSSLHEAIDRLFEDSWPTTNPKVANLPNVNVYESNNKIFIEADVPGVKEDDLSIEVGDESLTIKGERKIEQEVKEENFYHKETSYGSFLRTVPLPTLVNKDKAEAELKEGILIVMLPKKEKIVPKVTKIKVKKS